MKGRIRLIHWDPEEAEKKGRLLSDQGYSVDGETPRDFRFMQPLRQDPPRAVIIDISRAPARGRDVALMIRQSPRTRHIPILFVGGSEPKKSEIREQVPDAIYLSWEGVDQLLQRLSQGRSIVTPESHTLFEVYKGRSLVQKLALKEAERVSVIDPPLGFRRKLGSLPPRLVWIDGLEETVDLVLLFVLELEELRSWLDTILNLDSTPRLWICWPKKKSPIRSDLSASVIREEARSRGMSEYKVCSIDGVWTGKLFRLPGSLGTCEG